MARPIIFLAFANQEQEPFLDLSREDDGIYEIFANNNDLQVHRDQYTSTEELIRYIQAFRNKISIFHFGGHAGNAQLYLSDQVARHQGLSSLLGKQKNLRCVFLNGCHTKELVDHLLEKGVPVVIATDRAVGNEDAVQLAIRFYAALADGSTIKESFESARDAVQTSSDVAIELQGPGRGLDTVESTGTSFPWGLYYNDEKALDWQVGQARADIENVSSFFWLRLAFLLSAIFIFFLWSNRHFGATSTAFFLANGPLAILGIATFLMKAFQNLSPGISSVSDKLSTFFLKVPVLIAIGLIVAAAVLFGSSVVVQHEEGEALAMSVEDKNGHPVPQWPIDTGDPRRSRLFMIVSPFIGPMKLKAEGYQPAVISRKLFLGNRLSNDELRVKAALLIRLDLADLRIAGRIGLRIVDSSDEPIVVQPGEKASVLIGPQRSISERMLQSWEQELSSLPFLKADQIKLITNKWASPNFALEDYTFTPGDTVYISKILNDSTYFEKEIIIENQTINDVLLKI